MKLIEIRNRWTNAVLYSTQVEDDDQYPIRTALSGAYLTRAYLTRADLSGADLTGADLTGAHLSGADLTGAHLSGAYLSGADLSGADLTGAYLTRADLSGAYLSGAYLTRANLDPIRDDFRLVLDSAPREVAGLLAKLDSGEIDGSQYEGSCACLVGTIANVRGCFYLDLASLAPDAARASEKWFLAIRPGNTPDNHPVAAITRNWIVEWQAERGEGELIAEVLA